MSTLDDPTPNLPLSSGVRIPVSDVNSREDGFLSPDQILHSDKEGNLIFRVLTLDTAPYASEEEILAVYSSANNSKAIIAFQDYQSAPALLSIREGQVVSHDLTPGSTMILVSTGVETSLYRYQVGSWTKASLAEHKTSTQVDFSCSEKTFQANLGSPAEQDFSVSPDSLTQIDATIYGIPQKSLLLQNTQGSNLEIKSPFSSFDMGKLKEFGGVIQGRSLLRSGSFEAAWKGDSSLPDYDSSGSWSLLFSDNAGYLELSYSGHTVSFNGLDGVEVIHTNEWFDFSVDLPVGGDDCKVYVNKTLLTPRLSYTAGSGGSEAGIYSSQVSESEHSFFKTYSLHESAMKLLTFEDLAYSEIQVIFPGGLKDFGLIYPEDAPGRASGSSLIALANNVGGTITVTNINQDNPSATWNGLTAVRFSVKNGGYFPAVISQDNSNNYYFDLEDYRAGLPNNKDLDLGTGTLKAEAMEVGGVEVATAPKRYMGLIFAGQSNNCPYGEAGHLPDQDKPDQRIKQLGRYTPLSTTREITPESWNAFIPATHCGHHVQDMRNNNDSNHTAGTPESGPVGPELYVAQRLLPFLPTDMGILTIPQSRGGSGFKTSLTRGSYNLSTGASENSLRWGTDTPLYLDMRDRALHFLSLNPDNVLASVFWNQGEADGNSASNAANHRDSFFAMVQQFVLDMQPYASQCPKGDPQNIAWVCGSGTYTFNELGNGLTVLDGYKTLAEQEDNITFVDLRYNTDGSVVETNLEDPNADGRLSSTRSRHFSAGSFRGIVSDRYSSALLRQDLFPYLRDLDAMDSRKLVTSLQFLPGSNEIAITSLRSGEGVSEQELLSLDRPSDEDVDTGLQLFAPLEDSLLDEKSSGLFTASGELVEEDGVKCLRVNEASDYNISASGYASWTISSVSKRNGATGNMNIMSALDSDNLVIWYVGPTILTYAHYDDNGSPAETVDLAKFHIVTVSYDEETKLFRSFVDGKKIQEEVLTLSRPLDSDLNPAYRSSTLPLDGFIKSIRVYDRALSDSQIQTLVSRDLQGLEPFVSVDERLSALEEAQDLPPDPSNGFSRAVAISASTGNSQSASVQPAPFDHFPLSGYGITYDPATREFNIPEDGVYRIEWKAIHDPGVSLSITIQVDGVGVDYNFTNTGSDLESVEASALVALTAGQKVGFVVLAGSTTVDISLFFMSCAHIFKIGER